MQDGLDLERAVRAPEHRMVRRLPRQRDDLRFRIIEATQAFRMLDAKRALRGTREVLRR